MAHVDSSCSKGSRRAALPYKRIPVHLAPADIDALLARRISLNPLTEKAGQRRGSPG